MDNYEKLKAQWDQMTAREKQQKQLADLMLLSPGGKKMEITSKISTNSDGSMSFQVATKNKSEQYRVNIKIEEI